jgi:hypothetical protein
MNKRREQIESLLNMEDPITKRNYMSWDKGDCSEVGLCEILLSQLIREHKHETGEWYNRDYDEIKVRYE